ncbi:S-adenosylmethionine synthetase, partial [Salmonella enterica subsp. enterica serovar Poona]
PAADGPCGRETFPREKPDTAQLLRDAAGLK